MGRAALHIRNLGLRLSRDFAVVVEALDLKQGEQVVLDAVSGAGKSTALGLIAAALPSAGFPGEVLELNGHPVDRTDTERRFARPDTLGFVLQTNTLVPYLSVFENIVLPAQTAGTEIDPDWRDHLFEVLGLSGLLKRLPQALSVGQRQRVSVARALISKPAVLLLDEPVAALDPGNVSKVEQLISVLAQEAGSGVVLASHQAQEGAFAQSRRVRHRLLQDQGTTYSVFSDAPEQAA